MLTITVVLAIVGGSLAFKAKKGSGLRCVFTTATGAGNQCKLAGTFNVIYNSNDPTMKAFTTITITTQPGGDPTCTNPGVGLYTLGDQASDQVPCVPRDTIAEE